MKTNELTPKQIQYIQNTKKILAQLERIENNLIKFESICKLQNLKTS